MKSRWETPVTDIGSARRPSRGWLWIAALVAVGLAQRSQPAERQARREEEAEHPATASSEPGHASAFEFLKELYNRIQNDRVLAISAGVAFYALLAVFPAVAAGVSLVGIFADIRNVHADLSSFGTFLPGGAISIVKEQISRIAANGDRTLSLAALGGFALALWSSNAGMKSLFDALNIILKEHESRSFVRLNAISLAFTAGSIVVTLLIIAAVLAVRLPQVVALGMQQYALMAAVAVVSWLVIAVGIGLVYYFGPSRNDIPWRWITWGSAFAAMAWTLASVAFSWYAAHFGTYNKTYGSLGAGVGFMTWIWISVIVVLIGEEINEMLDRITDPLKAEKDARAHVLPPRKPPA